MISLWLGMLLLWLLPAVYVAYGLRAFAMTRVRWCWLGMLWLVCGFMAWLGYQHWGSAAAYRKALQLNHQVNAIQQSWQQDHGASVIAKIQAYCDQHPKDAKAWYWLARLQWRRGHLKGAKVALQKALRLQPHNPTFRALGDKLRSTPVIPRFSRGTQN